MNKLMFSLTGLLLLGSLSVVELTEQITTDLPLVITPAKVSTGAPLVLYFTGDGGWKPFSQDLANEWAKKGMPVIGVNSKKYFSDQKTPQQMARDFAPILNEYLTKWNRKDIVLAGFSFGANIIPFLENELSAELRTRVKSSILMSPTKTTDFQTHYIDMLNLGSDSYASKVFPELEKITIHPIFCFWGEEENTVLPANFHHRNLQVHYLKGGHDFENSEKIIALTTK